MTPILFCLTCAYLAYSSITYAASKNAVGVSLWVMAIGILVLLLMRVMRPRQPVQHHM